MNIKVLPLMYSIGSDPITIPSSCLFISSFSSILFSIFLQLFLWLHQALPSFCFSFSSHPSLQGCLLTGPMPPKAAFCCLQSLQLLFVPDILHCSFLGPILACKKSLESQILIIHLLSNHQRFQYI